MVNLELYRVFYVVANCGSLTKAASELYISQPAVSQAVKQLEIQVGGKLFVRTPKGMQLTKEGEMVHKYVREAILLLDEAQDKFNQMTQLAIGTVRIGASDTICRHFLLPHINLFRKQYPDIKLQVTNRTSFETLELLKNGGVDIAFVNLPMETTNDVEIVEECHELHDCFVASPEFEHLRDRTLTINEVNDYPLLMLELTANSRRAIMAFCHERGMHLHPEVELGSMDALIDFAKIGMGIACVPREYVENELKRGEVFEIKVLPELPTRGVALIVPSNSSYTNFAVQEFIKQVRKHS